MNSSSAATPELRRLAIAIKALGLGGAERVATRLANEWAARGVAVGLLTFEAEGARPFYALDPRVSVRRLGLQADSPTPAHALAANLARLRRLRGAIAAFAPDAVLSFCTETNVLVLLATRGGGWPVIAAERSDPLMYPRRRVWRLLRDLSYRAADAIVVQTAAASACFAGRRGVAVIPNPVPPPEPGVAAAAPVPGPFAVAVGRLIPEKRYDLLIAAFARVAARHPDWSLVILGDGPERAKLEALAAGTPRIRLPGTASDPTPILKAAALFALSSDFEGFPNALCEAMACGLPAIATDCRSGPREILREGIDGLLVPPGDEAALAAALDRLMGDASLRRRLGARAAEVAGRFAMPGVIAAWERTIERARAGRRA